MYNKILINYDYLRLSENYEQNRLNNSIKI